MKPLTPAPASSTSSSSGTEVPHLGRRGHCNGGPGSAAVSRRIARSVIITRSSTTGAPRSSTTSAPTGMKTTAALAVAAATFLAVTDSLVNSRFLDMSQSTTVLSGVLSISLHWLYETLLPSQVEAVVVASPWRIPRARRMMKMTRHGIGTLQ